MLDFEGLAPNGECLAMSKTYFKGQGLSRHLTD